MAWTEIAHSYRLPQKKAFAKENSMRNFATRTLKIGLLASLIASVSLPTLAENCSTATVKGEWGLTLNGTALLPSGPVPVAAVIRATLNLDGSVTGTEARSLGGEYADETMSGSYAVNADCTGSTTVNFYESGQLVRTSVLSMVFDSNSKQVRMVQKSLTLPDGTPIQVIITVDGRKQ